MRGAGPPELADKLHDEMTTLGWSVVELSPPAPRDGGPIDIRAVTESISGSAGVLVRKDDVVVWVRAVRDGAAAVEDTIPLAVDADASLAAMQLVEVLRARLIAAGFTVGPEVQTGEGDTSDAATEGAVEPDPSAASQTSETETAESAPNSVEDRHSSAAAPSRRDATRAPALWLGAGPGAHLSAGGVPMGFGGFVRAWMRPTERIGLGLDLSAALSKASVEDDVAEASVHPGLALAEVDYVVALEGLRAEVLLGAAAGLALVRVSGTATPPDVASSTWIPTAAFAAHARYRHAIGRSWALTLGGTLGATAPRPVVRLYDDVAASWGRPFALFQIGGEGRAF